MKSISKKTLVILCIIALATTVGVVVATGYSIRSPDSSPLVVNPTPTPTASPTPTPTPAPLATLSAVTFPASTITVGATTTLSTTLSDHTAGLPVDFYNQNGVKVGSGTTDSSGVASATITPPVGTWVYHANTTHP